MTQSEFDLLAAQVLSGEASSEEKLRLEETLAESADLRKEFANLKIAWTTLKVVGPLADCLKTPPATPPAKRLKEWHAAVGEQFGVVTNRIEVLPPNLQQTPLATVVTWLRDNMPLTRWSAAVLLVALATVGALLLSLRQPPTASFAPIAYLMAVNGGVELRRDGKVVVAGIGTALREADEIRLLSEASATVITAKGSHLLRGPKTFTPALLSVGAGGNETNATARLLRTALFQPPQAMLGLLVITRSSADIPVYSPIGFTADLTPLLLWKNQAGKTYDITISDEFLPGAAPLRQTRVTAPVEFTNAWPGNTLVRDGLYRLRIAESENQMVAGEITFQTLPQTNQMLSIKPADKLSAAYQLLVDDPPCFGDTLAILLTLPAESAESELGLRLKLAAFGRLGYEEDFHAVLARIQAAGN